MSNENQGTAEAATAAEGTASTNSTNKTTSPVLEPIAPLNTSNSTHVDTDPDGLEFSEGAFFAEVLEDGDCGVWMAATSNTDGLDFNDDNSSSSEETDPEFGECMFCNARGFVHNMCSECDSMFYPLSDPMFSPRSDSPPDDDSSGRPAVQEELDPALDPVRREIMAAFSTDRVSDNDVRGFLDTLGPHSRTVLTEQQTDLGEEAMEPARRRT